MIKAHKIRLNPTDEQAAYLWRAAGVARFAFNWGLARWNELYASDEKGISARGLKKEFNAVKADEFPWVAEVTTWAYQGAFDDLGAAVKRFFDLVKAGNLPKLKKPRKDGRPAGWPRFKRRNKAMPAFYLHSGTLNFDGNNVRFDKKRVGWINMTEPLRFDGKVMSGRVSHYGGHWWLSVAVEMDHEPTTHPGSAVGVDLGLKHLAATSDGELFDNPQALRQAERKLKRLNRQLSRRQKSGANWKKTKAKIGKVNFAIRSLRQDTLHNTTTSLTRKYGFIGLEDLNVKGMVQNHRLAKSVSDAAMSELKRQLTYKAEWNGATVQLIDRWYPSSKTCHCCGWIKDGLKLSDRVWTCGGCGAVLDRDINAAINIRDEALRLAALNNQPVAVVPTSRRKMPAEAIREAEPTKQEPVHVEVE